jgi:TolB-like protein
LEKAVFIKRKFKLNRKHLSGRRLGLLLCPAAALAVLAACSGAPAANGIESARGMAGGGSPAQNRPPSTRAVTGPLFTGNGGKGIAIAVPAPSLRGGDRADVWMPQLFQDIITGDLARYSAMTVLDRLNESLVLAEQELSASGNYSDDDYIAMGRLANAKYIAAGAIQRLSGRYSVSFRINDTETNAIRASFNKQYGAEDIESGLAAKEAARELLAGLGIELTLEGERQLLTVQESPVRAQVNLARGMAAENADNSVEALSFYIQALEANPAMNEAERRIRQFANVSLGASIQEREQYAQRQKEKWDKIFADLQEYVANKLPIVIYDFSTVKDTITDAGKRVNLAASPGVKIIPNRTVLAVWKAAGEEWLRVKSVEENKAWTESVRTALAGSTDSQNFDNVISYDVIV